MSDSMKEKLLFATNVPYEDSAMLVPPPDSTGATAWQDMGAQFNTGSHPWHLNPPCHSKYLLQSFRGDRGLDRGVEPIAISIVARTS